MITGSIDALADGARCPVALGARVRVYQLGRDVDWWVWLCARGVAEWRARGWQIRENRTPPFPDLPCDAHAAACR